MELEMLTTMDKIINTIWGKPQTTEKLSEGIYSVTTASHGGLLVREDIADKCLSEKARSFAELKDGYFQFEEDCCWAVVAVENPSLFSKKQVSCARKTIVRYMPEYISEYLAKRFFSRSREFNVQRANLAALTFPFDVQNISDTLMQEIVDEAEKRVPDEEFINRPSFFMACLREVAIEKGIPFAKEVSDWITTDQDCKQRCRIHVLNDNKGKPCPVFEYEQTIDGQKGSATINVFDYIDEKDFVEDYLKPYGYTSVNHVKSIYGQGWEQIIAECIFETDFNEFV